MIHEDAKKISFLGFIILFHFYWSFLFINASFVEQLFHKQLMIVTQQLNNSYITEDIVL